MMTEPVKLITTKPDKELAAEHKAAIIEASKPFIDALSKANREGFQAQLNFGPDAFGNIVITTFILVKSF